MTKGEVQTFRDLLKRTKGLTNEEVMGLMSPACHGFLGVLGEIVTQLNMGDSLMALSFQIGELLFHLEDRPDLSKFELEKGVMITPEERVEMVVLWIHKARDMARELSKHPDCPPHSGSTVQ